MAVTRRGSRRGRFRRQQRVPGEVPIQFDAHMGMGQPAVSVRGAAGLIEPASAWRAGSSIPSMAMG
jgi:hypothetical protein